jgi:class 3 adenylate cyclase
MFVADPDVEWPLLRDIDSALAARNAGIAYGSAAAGADILVMEAVLARGGEVHIVLPCRKEDFVERSVKPAGEAWLPRFEYCMKKATQIVYATEMDWISDPALFGYNAMIGMGLAKLRAQQLDGDVFQLAVWDGSGGGPVGTAADVRLWQEKGGETVILKPEGINRDYPRKVETTTPPMPRRLAAVMFTDYAGFSKISERFRPNFGKEIKARIAAVLNSHGDRVLARNFWGDALYCVMNDAATAADIALGIQRSMSEVDPDSLGLKPGQGGMRIAVHYGSVYETVDEITGRPSFEGNEVDRAARIEPVTPPGAVYVTEPMAAMLVLEAPDRFDCQYVGRVELAKKYGTFPMYKLTGVGEAALYEDDSADSADEGEAMTSETSPRLFVSHHSSKLPVAEHVEKALNAKGVNCWIAPRDIEPGDQWPTAIRNAIEATDAVLLLFCSRSEKSRQVKRELILADQLGKAIIPLRLERIDPGELSYHLADSQWIDWLEQRDVVIDRIANKAHEFQRHGPMETAPPVIEPARGSVDDVPPIDPTRPPSPMPPAPPAPPAAAPEAHVPTGFISLGKDQTATPPPPTPPPPMPAAGGFDTQRSSFADLPPAPPPGPATPAGSWSPPAGSWPPPPGPDRGPAPPASRKGLYIILGLLGAILLAALIYLAVASGGGDEDDPRPADREGEITESWFAGSWADDRGCNGPITRFNRDGSFSTAEGGEGSWRITGGDTLIVDGGGRRLELNLRRISNDEVRVSGDLNGTSYRCD